jgi:DNA-directed RNA polymerase specialized sigma24 family protein
MTYQQIADAIGTTQQGAQQLVSRALIKFKREAAKRNINLKGFFYD